MNITCINRDLFMSRLLLCFNLDFLCFRDRMIRHVVRGEFNLVYPQT